MLRPRAEPEAARDHYRQSLTGSASCLGRHSLPAGGASGYNTTVGRRWDFHVSPRFQDRYGLRDHTLAGPDVAPSSRGLGRWPFKPETRIRIPLGPLFQSLKNSHKCPFSPVFVAVGSLNKGLGVPVHTQVLPRVPLESVVGLVVGFRATSEGGTSNEPISD